MHEPSVTRGEDCKRCPDRSAQVRGGIKRPFSTDEFPNRAPWRNVRGRGVGGVPGGISWILTAFKLCLRHGDGPRPAWLLLPTKKPLHSSSGRKYALAWPQPEPLSQKGSCVRTKMHKGPTLPQNTNQQQQSRGCQQGSEGKTATTQDARATTVIILVIMVQASGMIFVISLCSLNIPTSTLTLTTYGTVRCW